MNTLAINNLTEYTEAFRAAYKQTARGIWTMAEVAAKVHGQVGYDGYVEWLKAEFDLSDGMGKRLLNVHRSLIATYKLSVDTIETIAPSALYLLASPSTPDPVRDHFIEAAKNGRPVTHAAVKVAVMLKVCDRCGKQWAADLPQCPYCTLTVDERIDGLNTANDEERSSQQAIHKSQAEVDAQREYLDSIDPLLLKYGRDGQKRAAKREADPDEDVVIGNAFPVPAKAAERTQPRTYTVLLNATNPSAVAATLAERFDNKFLARLVAELQRFIS